MELSQDDLARGWDRAWGRSPAAQEARANEAALLALRRWKDEGNAGRAIARIAVAFEAGRDGFWLARWLRARDVEAHVIHPTSIAVSREHRRAKTDRLDTELLKRAFLGWLRGEPGIAAWRRFQLLKRRTPSVRAVSGRTWLLNAPASSTG